jgi:FkbM family methyltransferase
MLGAVGFAQQKPIEFNFFGYPLLVPSGHPLLGLFTERSQLYQPYREAGLIKIIQALHLVGRSGTVIDIGANVGDSCAIIHRHSKLKIICVEASDFFFGYLAKNVERLFADRAIARHSFVVTSPDENPKGLYHWGGTAKLVDAPFVESCAAVAIGSLLSSVDEVALLKVDTDGLDIELISGVFDDGGTPRFPCYFEYEFPNDSAVAIRNHGAKLLALCQKVAAAGYISAFVWDDAGRFFGLIDLRDPAGITNAINYMGHLRYRPVWGFDICLLHQSDTMLASDLCKIISRELIMPISVS